MRQAWLVRGDIDGFFGLFLDNLLQLLLIGTLCREVCGFPDELVAGRILPGAALSILVGNVLYGWQARRLMRLTGREDVTALPYGINTPSLLAYVFLIMKPVREQTGDLDLTWRVGLFACLMSGMMETAGAFAGDWLRRHTPRAALLSALAGIAIALIAMGFVFQIYTSPWLGIIPMMLILATYAGRLRLPWGLPGGLVAVGVGLAVAWISHLLGADWFRPRSWSGTWGLHLPVPAIREALSLLADPIGWRYMAVIVPMGLFNVVGSLQNLESAEAAGDRYETRGSLLVNGLGSLVAGFFGSAFPTTIYIGHPGWKAMGARSGYSTLNGIVVSLLCLGGVIGVVERVVPLEVMLGILVWIGIIITAQAFEQSPREHALAVAIGLLPALAYWGLSLIESSLAAAGGRLIDCMDKLIQQGIPIRGLLALSQGFLLTSMILSTVMVYLIERRFLRASAWMTAAGVLSTFGLIHAYRVTAAGVENELGMGKAADFAAVYGLTAALFLGLHLARRRCSEGAG